MSEDKQQSDSTASMSEDEYPPEPLPLQDREAAVSLDADLILELTTGGNSTARNRRSSAGKCLEKTSRNEEDGGEECNDVGQIDEKQDALQSEEAYRAALLAQKEGSLLDDGNEDTEGEHVAVSISKGDGDGDGGDKSTGSGSNLYRAQQPNAAPAMGSNVESTSDDLTRSVPGAVAVQGPNIPLPHPVQREEEEEENLQYVPQTTLTVQDSDWSGLTVAAEVSQDESELRAQIRRSILDEAVKADAIGVEQDRNRKKAYTAIAIVCIVAIIIGVVFGGKRSQDRDTSSLPDPCAIFSSGHFPDYELQCECFGEIRSPGNLQIYGNLSAMVNATEDVYSCSPRNMALWWLASDTGFRNTTSEDQQKTIAQRYALALFYISTSGSNWVNNHNWLSTVDECRWHGVRCTSRGIGISQLDLSDQNLNGTIPTELSHLSSLRSLKLARNSLTGSIQYNLPESWPLLRRLDISHNHLSGKIPGFVPNLAHLMADYYKNPTAGGRQEILRTADRQVLSLDFSHNRFTGMLPPDISLLESLRSFKVEYNSLTGYLIPIQDYHLAVAGFQEIEVLSIAGNDIFGRLPTEIGLTTDLEVMDFSSTLYQGPIPSEIGNLVEMERLDLSNSSFTGTIPTDLLRLSQLEYLNLNSPGFTGTLPQDICDLLVYIDDIIEVDCDGSLAEGCKCCGCDPEESY